MPKPKKEKSQVQKEEAKEAKIDQAKLDEPPNLVKIPIEKLVPAAWNYKELGTPETMERLKESIKRDRTAGVLPVRNFGNNQHEVIDGNHRLDAIKELGWKVVWCEDFGNITKAEAIVISRRRNYKWFDDDMLKLAELYRDDVLPEINLDELDLFMPDTREQIEDMAKLLDFDWDQFSQSGQGKSSKDSGMIDNISKTIKINVSAEFYSVWMEWMEESSKVTGLKTEQVAFEHAIKMALDAIKNGESVGIGIENGVFADAENQ